ncbi:hypothetical protein [Argonema galeatum]|uniref:hypothetical protein n=1 Tax=Argonema galeatum TaxID=2942762 RepID=UPI002010F6F8|nr:hypothetical protein [Argonema galeatum]MCL1463404.1 hypothetical protein [Argonema galeatum A003/A1]
MIEIKEIISEELEKLNEEQLRQVADYIAFVKFHARRASLRENESKLALLYSEFAEKDRVFAEEGMDEYAEMLRNSD